VAAAPPISTNVNIGGAVIDNLIEKKSARLLCYMRDVVNCLVCHKNKKKASFQITQTIAGGFLYETDVFVDKDICQNCLKPESIVRLKDRKTLHVSLVPYKEDFVKCFWERCKFNRNDILSLSETTDILIKEKILKDSLRDTREYRKRGRDWVKARDPRIIFRLDIPSNHDNNLSLMEANFVKKSDLTAWIDRTKRNPMTNQDFRVCRRNKVSKGKMEKLTYLGYVRFDKDGLPKFGNDCINKKRVCLDCGDLKDFDDFYTHANGGITYTCLECESARKEVYYKENVDKLKEYNKKYRNSDRGKEREKFYRSKPENKMRRNLRQRLKVFMEQTSEDNYGKDICMTNRELKAYIESLFHIYIPDMTWDDYGSGKNGDHKDSWHIDHIIPLSGWDEFKYIHPLYFEGMSPNHWSNIRPLNGLENISRGGTNNKKYYKRKTEVIDLEEINAHFLAMADLYPDKGFGPINWPIKLQESQEQQKESIQLDLDLV